MEPAQPHTPHIQAGPEGPDTLTLHGLGPCLRTVVLSLEQAKHTE